MTSTRTKAFWLTVAFGLLSAMLGRAQTGSGLTANYVDGRILISLGLEPVLSDVVRDALSRCEPTAVALRMDLESVNRLWRDMHVDTARVLTTGRCDAARRVFQLRTTIDQRIVDERVCAELRCAVEELSHFRRVNAFDRQHSNGVYRVGLKTGIALSGNATSEAAALRKDLPSGVLLRIGSNQRDIMDDLRVIRHSHHVADVTVGG